MKLALVLVHVVAVAACRAPATQQSAGAPPGTEVVRVAVAPTESVDITRDNEVRTLQLSASRSRVWSALMATHDAIRTTASVLDAGAGTATFIHQNSKRLMGRPLSAYVDCGRTAQGPRADIYNVTLRVNERLTSQGENTTTLHTVVSAWAKPMGMTGDPVQCYTLGSLERRIAEILLTRLQS